MPHRVQQRRTKGWRKGPNDVYVGRPSKWGNPHPVKPPATDADIERYRADLVSARLRVTVDDVRRELRGKNLACWCALDAPCHADVLLEIANT